MASLKDTNILGKLVVTDKIIKSGGTSNDILLANGDTITKSALSGQITNNTTYSFTGGTNCFYVTPSDGSQQTVTVTPSIDLSGYVTLSTLQTISGKKVFSANHGGSATITSDLDAIKLAAVNRGDAKGTYFPGIGWNNLEIWSSNTYVGGAQAWIGTRLVDTAGSELVDLVFATKEDNTGGPIRPIERMCITYQGNVGIGIKEPSSLLHVNGKIKASSLEVTSILAPTTSGGATYGVGSDGQVLKSNGTTVYWGTDNSGSGGLTSLPTRLADYSTTGYGDANEATAQGWHYMTTTATNRPPFKQSANKDYRIMSTAYSTAWVQQIATDFRGNDMFLRRKQDGTWKPWTPIVRFQDCTADHKMQTITDNAIPRWDTGGTAMLQNSTATISDKGHLTINTTSDTTMTTPAINVLHTGPANANSTADLMILSGYNSAPYGFKFSTHGSGTAIIQSQRISGGSENFNLSLNPNGGDVLINGNKAATQAWVEGKGYLTGSYLPLAGGTMTGAIVLPENKMALKFRTHASSYETGLVYGTTGNEALTFAIQNPVTAFQIVYGTKPSAYAAGTWQSVTPLFQTKDGRVIINRKIAQTSDTSSLKLLDVNGDVGINGMITFHGTVGGLYNPGSGYRLYFDNAEAGHWTAEGDFQVKNDFFAKDVTAMTMSALTSLNAANVYCTDTVQSTNIAADTNMTFGGETVATRKWVETYVQGYVDNDPPPTYNILGITFWKNNISGGGEDDFIDSFTSESSNVTESLNLRYNYNGTHNIYTIDYTSREGSIAISCSTATLRRYQNYVEIRFNETASHTIVIADTVSGYQITLQVSIQYVSYVD